VIAVLGEEQGLDADQEALLAASYQRLDQHEAAIQHYQLALQQDAKNARNWVGLAISQEQSAAFGAALDAYQQASRLGGLNTRLRDFVERRSEKLQQVVN
jgi:MSHA biogenesis protein MshN